MSQRARIVSIVGSLIAVAAQIVLAPHLTIGGATPNFLLAIFVPIALLTSPSPRLVLGVLLGIVFDLTQGGPVGAYTLILSVLSLAIPFFTSNLDNTNLLSQIVTIVILTLVGNILNIIFVSFATPAINILSLIQSGALIEIVSDSAFAILFFVILGPIMRQTRSNPTILGN